MHRRVIDDMKKESKALKRSVDDCVVHSRHIIYCFNVAPV